MKEYKNKKAFSVSIGFDSPGKAISSIGLDEFKFLYNKYLEDSQYVVLDDINSNYILYKDGRIFSKFYDKFLKPYKPSNYKHKPHLSYNLSITPNNKINYQISRLVMFYFSKHKYKTIKEMPNIMFIDGDPENFKIENLKFDLNNEIIKKISSNVDRKNLNCKIPKTAILDIKKMLSDGSSLNKIALLYDVSDMSVFRFKKRHNL